MVMPRATGGYATLGTAADWLLRYLVHPAVDYSLAIAGAELARSRGVDATGRSRRAVGPHHRRDGR